MNDTPTPETDTEAANSLPYPYFVPAKFARRLEQERNEAREELARVRKELAASNRGAKINAHINNSLCSKVIQAERERDEARRDRVASEELHRRRFGTLKAEFEQALEERDEAKMALDEFRKKLDDSDVVIRLVTERNQAREIARLAFYIIRGVDPKFVKLAYEKSVYWVDSDQPIQFMRDAIKQWDK